MTKLNLCFETRNGKTYLSKQFVSSPLKIIRPFDLDDGHVLLQIVNVGPGVMAGDDFDISVTLKAGAKVVLLNQSATKLHSMSIGESAKQDVKIQVEDGAELEYYPGLTIPFKETVFKQSTTVNLARTAKFAFVENWAMGRIAFNERFMFTSLSSQIKVFQNKKLLYADALELNQATPKLGITDDFSYLANGVWFWNVLPTTTAKSSIDNPIQSPLLDEASLVCAPFLDDAVYMRALANDSLNLRTEVHGFINQWRVKAGLGEIDFSRYSS